MEWKVVTANPKQGELPRLPGGIRSLLSFRWLRTLKALRKSDGMVLGGGSLFTDAESVYACILWWIHVFFARLFRKKIILAHQGIGPFRTRIGKFCAQSAVRSAHFVSVRDSVSYDRICTWKTKGQILESFDPVFSMVEKQEVNLSAQKVLIVVPRDNSSEELQNRLVKLIESGRFERINILSLKPDDSSEQRYCQLLQSRCSVPCTLVCISELQDLTGEIAKGSYILTQRYHGAIVALALFLI